GQRPGSMRTGPICIGTASTRTRSREAFRKTHSHAAPRHFRAHGTARWLERDRPADDGHVPAILAGYFSAAPCIDRAGAVHDFRLPDRVRGGADSLWADFRPS